MSGLPTLAQVEEAMGRLYSPSSSPEDIYSAGNYLKTLVRMHFSLPILFEILHASQNPAFRQSAAVLLRSAVNEHWMKIDAKLKEEVKTLLFVRLTQEPERFVRRCVARLLAAVARVVLSSRERWDRLPANLFEVAQSPMVEHREAALGVFDVLFQSKVVADQLGAVLEPLLGFIAKSLDPKEDAHVQVAAFKTLTSVVSKLEKNQGALNSYRGVFPGVLASIESMVRNGKDEEAIDALGIFDDLIECPVPYLGNNTAMLVKFLLELAKTRAIDMPVRQEAISVLLWLAQYKPKLMKQYDLMPQVVRDAFILLAEPDENEDDDDAEWDLTAHVAGANLVDKYARFISPKKVFELCMPIIDLGIKSSNPHERRAALGALTVLAKPCKDQMLEAMKPLLDIVYRGMQDAEFGVRKVACLSLGQFAQHLQPEIIDEYEKILPLIFQSMNETNPHIQERSCFALVSFAENLEERVLPYVEPLMQRLITLMQTSSKTDIQEMAVSGIAAVASAAGKKFVPYAKTVLEMVKGAVTQETSNLAELRGCVTEMVGVVALAIGKEEFAPYFPYFMEEAFKGMLLEEMPGLRSYTYSFFGNVAECLGRDAKGLLPQLMPFVKAGLDNSEGVEVGGGDHDGMMGRLVGDDGNVADESKYIVDNSLVDEKISCLRCLAAVAYCTKEDFLPHLENMFESVHFLLQYIHPTIRKTALEPAIAFVAVFNHAYPVKRGHISRENRTYIDTLMAVFMAAILKDHEPSVVAATLLAIKRLIKLVGAVAVEPHMNKLVPLLVRTLRREIFCFQVAEDVDETTPGDGYDDDGEREQDEFAIFVNTSKVMGTLAKEIGGHFMQLWPLIEEVGAYVSHTDESYRHEAIGTVGTLTDAMGAAIGHKFNWFLDVAKKGLRDPYGPSQQNAAYLAGSLIKAGEQNTVRHYKDLLSLIQPVLGNSEFPATQDNACGFLGRLLTLAPPNSIPTGQVISALVAHLPLREDFTESRAVYLPLAKLYQEQNNLIGNHVPKLVPIFAEALRHDKEMPEDLVNILVGTVRAMLNQHGAQLQPVLSQLTPQQAEVVQKCMQAQ